MLGDSNGALMTADEVADKLRVCVRTVLNLTKAGRLPSVRIGRAVRYDPADLQAFVDRTKQSAGLKVAS